MDSRTRVSSIGEAAITLKFTEDGYDVFMSVSGKSPFDKVVHKDGRLYRVEVKTTSQRNDNNTGWVIELRRIRSNKTTNKIYPFNKDASDILAVYIEPIKRVLLLNTPDIKQTSMLTVLDKDL